MGNHGSHGRRNDEGCLSKHKHVSVQLDLQLHEWDRDVWVRQDSYHLHNPSRSMCLRGKQYWSGGVLRTTR